MTVNTEPGVEPSVTVEGLTKVYGSGEDAVRAVDGIDFEIEPGTVVGLLGPNGAGKTTTIKSLLGLVLPTEGTVRVCGVDVQEHQREAYQHVAAMLEGARNVYWRLTVRENLEFFAALARQRPSTTSERREKLLAQFDLEDKADTPVRELSRGQKQKVSLACTLARNAEVLFLDEPSLGLDVESTLNLRTELRRLVEDDERTMLLSSHDMNVVEDICDRIIILQDGEIIVDEATENLLDVIRNQTYAVRVEDTIPSATRDRLRTEFDVTDFEDYGKYERFLAQVTPEEFYSLTETLQSSDVLIASINAVESDLAEVFLHVTDEADERGELR